MLNWPPSPSVEDEATALAHEHLLDASIQSLKSEDQPAPSRGSVDQYPIIIDSDVQQQPAKPEYQNQNQNQNQNQQPSFEPSTYEVSSSDDSAGPHTPPPPSRRDTIKDSKGRAASNRNYVDPPPLPHNSTSVEELTSTRSRPQGIHVQTNLDHKHCAPTNHRCERSPYSYSRMSASQRYYPEKKVTDEPFLSPSRAVSSPVSVHQNVPGRPPITPRTSDSREPLVPEANMSVRREARSRSRYREGEPKKIDRDRVEVRNTAQPDKVRSRSTARANSRQTLYNVADRHNVEHQVMSLPSSRRHSKESTHVPSDGERSEKYRPEYSRKSTRDVDNSSYTSSIDDSPREYRRKEDRDVALQQRRSHRKSSHRRERPQIINLADRGRSETLPVFANDSTTTYHHDGHARGRMEPMTPLTADGSKVMEDYFEKAFRENDIRRLQDAYVPRSSGSALASPMTTSPPRTPRSERQSRDYFSTASMAPRPIQRSRPPSVDEGQMKDFKLHTSLLSAATTGAAMAAVSAGPSPRSSGQFTESDSSTSSTSVNRQASTSQSRRSSPVYERFRLTPRNTSYTGPDVTNVTREPSIPTPERRPVSRGDANIATDDHTPWPPRPHLHPHRALSYSGPEQHQSFAAPASSVACFSGGTVPQSRSIRPLVNSLDLSAPPTVMTKLAVCPRSQPSIGHQDWYTINGLSDVNICPTCMSVMGHTRYRDLFIPSPSRSHRQVVVCAMSSTWVRIAFLQSLRQNRPDLDYIEGILTLPDRVSECAGARPDLRRWFDVVDPSTRAPVPNFFACSACAYRVDIVFPSMQAVFDRGSSKLVEEHVCSLHTAARNFHSIIDQLERAERRCQGRRWRPMDVEPLMRQIRKAGRPQSCRKDEIMTSCMWHFMPDLPEFTVCEECYDEVVWPLSDRPIARDMSKTPKLVAGRRSAGGNGGTSCQLYSERMRKLFREAVINKDFELLRDGALTRYEVHQRLCDVNAQCESDWRAGIDRRAEVERTREIWRRME